MSKALEAAAEEFLQKIRDMAVLTSPTMASASIGITDTFIAGAEWAIRDAPSVLGLVKCIEYILQYDKNSPERQRMKDALAQYDKESGNG